MTTSPKDFKVKNGLQVGQGGSFGGAVTVGTPTSNSHAATKEYVDTVATGGGAASDSFKTISVAGQDNVVADSSTDTLTFVAGTNVNITTNAATDSITINSTDTNTTYSVSAETTTGGANLRLTGSDTSTDNVKIAGSGSVTVTRTDADTITISGTDTNTTYTAGTGLTLSGTEFSINTATTVDLNTAQTLTNKTLTSPTITGTGSIAGTFTGNLTGNVTGNVSGNAGSVTNGVYTTDTGTVTSTMIANGTIVDADINASAAIAISKLATDPLARANHTGTQTASTISDFNTQVRTNRLDQMAVPTASVSMNTQKITNLDTPSADSDAATKAYVDAATVGLNVHASVRAATTSAGGNIDLSTGLVNGTVIDGITLATGNRVLVKNQSTTSQNGVYIVAASGAASRATDYDSTPEVDAGDFIFVESGTINGKTGWVQTNTVSTIGSDPIEFTQFSGAGTYLAGNGLTLTGNSFSIDTSVTVDTSTSQTLSNKTLTAPRFSSAGEIDDANGAELIKFPATVASAVNEVTISNAATGAAPSITATGDDTNISLNLVAKGTGTVQASGVPVVTTTGTQTLTNKTLTNPTFNGQAAVRSTSGSPGMEIGRSDGTSSTPYIDFNSGATLVDYDSRIIASGGTGSIGGGSLQIVASSLTLPAATSIGNISSTEIGYLDNATSNIQSQLDGKSPIAGSTSITTVGTVTTATSPTAAGSTGLRNITISTAEPTGGADGDVWLVYV